ncbi:hypothetical protein [uncultured Limosilactobacillus sp.]|uniref:hypothetical protein n=1 Tax=uncultured Limosilactobacillus sp. TaxID=2837629 RepID=UPI00259165A8|nr:hypothetical protein [uncultured Limosilactobacillus sp.]
MADNLKMKHGEPSWDVKHNALVDAVEKMGGVVNGLQWTDRTDTGIVLPAGLQYIDQNWYMYAQVGQHKLVHLHLNLKVTGEIKGSIVLPDVIKMGAPAIGLANDHTFWTYYGTIDFHQLANQRALAVDDPLLIDKVYGI